MQEHFHKKYSSNKIYIIMEIFTDEYKECDAWGLLQNSSGRRKAGKRQMK